jgi:GH25 family lysozyme M1 (1,4-beta-N-acetylmuramidase)
MLPPTISLAARKGRARAALAVSSLALAVACTLSASASAEAFYRGVDVSNHQGEISWSRVAASGERFAFAKATEGVTYTDPWYATNRHRARYYGLKFGAYHFARPDDQSSIRNDAYAEADHFVATANLKSGFLLPVLDLETPGNLSPGRLKYWVQKYLARIQSRLGTKAIIYTYPSFWERYMSNTTWFAANGYRVLWIANWRVSRPSVPANNWEGRGWTFWQWDDCGNVPGISGCVDRDYYRYHYFKSVLIP